MPPKKKVTVSKERLSNSKFEIFVSDDEEELEETENEIMYLSEDESGENINIALADLVNLKIPFIKKYNMYFNGFNRDDTGFTRHIVEYFDKYLLNIIEEISEFSYELESFEGCEMTKLIENEDEIAYKILYELIDVIGYEISLLAMFYYIYNHGYFENGDEKKDILNEMDVKMDSISKVIYRENPKLNLTRDLTHKCYVIFMKEINNYIKIRREFPERKYHKPLERILSFKEMQDIYNSSLELLISNIKDSIVLFMLLTNNNYDLFNYMIFNKNKSVFESSK